jgi:hypothetical protein
LFLLGVRIRLAAVAELTVAWIRSVCGVVVVVVVTVPTVHTPVGTRCWDGLDGSAAEG